MVGIIDSWPSAILVSVIGAVILAISCAIIAFVYTEYPKLFWVLFSCAIGIAGTYFASK